MLFSHDVPERDFQRYNYLSSHLKASRPMLLFLSADRSILVLLSVTLLEFIDGQTVSAFSCQPCPQELQKEPQKWLSLTNAQLISAACVVVHDNDRACCL